MTPEKPDPEESGQTAMTEERELFNNPVETRTSSCPGHNASIDSSGNPAVGTAGSHNPTNYDVPCLLAALGKQGHTATSTSTWIPACAGMTKCEPCEGLHGVTLNKQGSRKAPFFRSELDVGSVEQYRKVGRKKAEHRSLVIVAVHLT